MTMAALLDVGLPLEDIRRELAKLPISGFDLEAERVMRGPIAATHVTVHVDPSHEAPQGRRLEEVLAIIHGSTLPQRVQDKGAEVFRRLARAEAKVHGVDMERVRLHHVGEIDTIVDVMGAVAGLDLLDVQKVYASPLPLGGPGLGGHHPAEAGQQQYRIPLPGPATLELVAMAQAPVQPSQHGGPAWELVTPTGAALVTTLATFQRPAMTLERVGYGAGSSDFPEVPNVLRVWIGEVQAAAPELVLLETNIDDQSPQVLGYAMERLLEEGARDVWFTPIQMKKNRPATMVSVLAPAPLVQNLTSFLLRETSTLGVRATPVQRHEADREIVEFTSSLGTVRVKLKRFGGRAVAAAPEYEDCKRLARERGLPLQDVLRQVAAEATQALVRQP
ncbi:MAG: nickel pincer cofactor biosynthesis protein LarC [Dehalococcoidia bacterium]|nr:nickel pincer cofactor biosynthesis protein LarC [Dehalococcoidia bacterium]